MRYIFPENFYWGASTSSHQIEGDNRNNDWWKWEYEGNTERSGKACDHYHRFKDDFQLAKDIGHNAHRLSIEWSRLERSEGVWDDNEWNHYKKVINTLKSLEIEPFVTLNHFTIPLWLADKGGWLNPSSIGYFSRFAAKAVKELGNNVKFWFTFNEPNILAILAYDYGMWPPCSKNLDEAILVLRNMLKSHVSAYVKMNETATTIPDTIKPIIGIAKAVTTFHPFSKYSPLDRLVTGYRSWFHNYSFITSAIKGRIVIPSLGTSSTKREILPAKNTVDYIGLNYYFRHFIQYKRSFFKNPIGDFGSHHDHPDGGKTTDMGWEIYPRGIYEVIKSFSKYNLPMIIAENGIATTNDDIRKEYIKDHLNFVQLALSEKSDVFGYLHWSLIDNFEWSEGYSKRFGLIHVDFETQKRTIKNSAKYLEAIIRTGIV